MSDIKKIVEIAVKVTGVNKSAFTPLINAFKTIEKTIESAQKKVGEFQKDVKKLKVPEKVKTDLNTLKTSADKASKGVQDLGRSFHLAGSKARTFGDRIKTVVQYKSIIAGIQAIQTVLVGAIQSIVEYDQALKDLQAITGASALEVEQMGDKIIEVASKTKFSATEIAQGMRVIGQAGFSASEAVETMQAISDLATGTLTDMASTVDLVTTAMRVFSIDASRSGEVVDVFANAVNKSKLTIDKLRTAFNYVGPIAKEAGISFQELSASMGTLANSGLRASTIGTGLRRVFAELVDPSDKMRAAAQKAGVALSDLNPATAGLENTISNLGLVLSDTQTSFDLFGKRGAAAALALTDSSSGFSQMLMTIGETGTAAEMAGIQIEGLAVSWKNLTDRLGILAIKFGELGIADAMKILIDVGKALIKVMTALIDNELARFIAKSALVVGAAIAMVKAFGLIAAAITGMPFAASAVTIGSFTATILKARVAVFAFITSLGPLAIPIAVLTTAMILLKDVTKDFAREAAEEASKMADTYGKLAKTAEDYRLKVAGIDETSKEYTDANKDLRASLIEVASSMDEISSVANRAIQSIHPLTGEILDGGKALEAYRKELDSITTQKLSKAVKEAGESFKGLNGIVSRFINRTKDAFGQLGIYVSAFGKVLSNVVNFDISLDSTIGEFTRAFKLAKKQGEDINEAWDFAELARQGKKSFKDISDYVANLDYSKDLTAQQTDIVEGFKFVNEQTTKFVDHLLKTGQVDLRDTNEQITEIAKAAGFSGVELDAVQHKLTELRKHNESTFSNIIEKWERDLDPKFLTNLIAGYENVGGAISEADRVAIAFIDSERSSLVNKLQMIKQETAARIQARTATDSFFQSQAEKEQALLLRAEEVKTTIAQSSIAQRMILIAQEQDKSQKELEQIDIKYENRREERARKRAGAIIATNKRINVLLHSDVNGDQFKAQTNAYKSSLQERETELKHHISNLTQMEAEGHISSDELRSETSDSQERFYRHSVKLSREYRDEVKKEVNPEEYDKRHNIVLKAEEDYYKVRTRLVESYNKEISSSIKKIKTANIKQTEEVKENADKIKDIEQDRVDKLLSLEKEYTSKREAINKSLKDKLAKIDEQIADNRKSSISDRLSLEQDSEEKIRNVRNRGLTDVQKSNSDASTAFKKLSQGRNLLAQAEREGDSEKLSRGTDMIKLSESLASGVMNERTAVKILEQSLQALKKARSVEEEIKEIELLEQKKKEVAEAEVKREAAKVAYDEKVVNATNAIDKIAQAEEKRHNKEMANLRAEIALYNEKVNAAQRSVSSLTGNSLEDTSSMSEENIRSISKETEAIRNRSKAQSESAKQASENYTMTIENGVKSFVSISQAGQESINEIATSIDENGVKSFTNVATYAGEAANTTVNKFALLEERSVASIQAVEGSVRELKASIESIKDKVVKITTKHVTEGKKAVKKMMGGGKLPGFGGGDRNHLLAEDGEWVINKYASRYFGDQFMSSINNMSLPKYANGGKVGTSGSAKNSSYETLVVRFQAGDVEAPVKVTDPSSRKAIKNMAKELTKMRLTYAK